MSYRVEFGGGAQIQFHTLPQDAREALIERAIGLSDRPWDEATVRPPGDDTRFRETVFGSGQGVLGFHVNEPVAMDPAAADAAADLAELEKLAAELTARGYQAGLCTPDGRLPYLRVCHLRR